MAFAMRVASTLMSCWCGRAVVVVVPCTLHRRCPIWSWSSPLFGTVERVVVVVGVACGCGGVVIVVLWSWSWSSRCDDSLGVGCASVGVYTGPVTK